MLAGVSVCIGWYFNVRYVFDVPGGDSWMHFTAMLFDQPGVGIGRGRT